MSKLKRTSRTPYKARYTAYKNEDRAGKNFELKLLRHLKAHPDDSQAKKALTKGHTQKSKPRNKTYPATEVRVHSEVRMNRKTRKRKATQIFTNVKVSRKFKEMTAAGKRAWNAHQYAVGIYGEGNPNKKKNHQLNVETAWTEILKDYKFV